MHKIQIKNFKYKKRTISELDVFIDDLGNIVILPSLFSLSLRLGQSVYREKETKNAEGNSEVEIVHSDITEPTLAQYISYLSRYLSFLEKSSMQLSFETSVHTSEVISGEFLNYYINDILVKQGAVGTSGIYSTITAISSYYYWLAHAGLCQIRWLCHR